MKVLLALVFATLACSAGVAVWSRGSGLPDQGSPGDFVLVERSGAAFGAADLRGRPWIAGFVFVNCAGPCPMITTRMATLQAALPKGIALVSFTVDPERDTPDKLRRYADNYGAEAGRWYFLTGTTAAIDRVVREGFHLAATKDPGTATDYQITHSTRLVLVDRKGRIRGSYVGVDDDAVAQLEVDARRLLASGE